MNVCVDLVDVGIVIYFTIALIFAVVVFRDQKGKMGIARAVIVAVLVGLFWWMFAIMLLAMKGKTDDQEGEPTAESKDA